LLSVLTSLKKASFNIRFSGRKDSPPNYFSAIPFSLGKFYLFTALTAFHNRIEVFCNIVIYVVLAKFNGFKAISFSKTGMNCFVIVSSFLLYFCHNGWP